MSLEPDARTNRAPRDYHEEAPRARREAGPTRRPGLGGGVASGVAIGGVGGVTLGLGAAAAVLLLAAAAFLLLGGVGAGTSVPSLDLLQPARENEAEPRMARVAAMCLTFMSFLLCAWWGVTRRWWRRGR
jgi:predicted lipid-binding transport protein (Tim44 family)